MDYKIHTIYFTVLICFSPLAVPLMHHNDPNSESYSAKLTALDRIFLTIGAQSTQEGMIISDLQKMIYILWTTVKVRKALCRSWLPPTRSLTQKKKKSIQDYSDPFLEEKDITTTPNFYMY